MVTPTSPRRPPSAKTLALTRAVVFVTTYCNFRCGFCEFAADTLPRERKFHFPVERWESFLDEFKELGGRELYLTGGEPLMHPNFWDLVEIARQRELPVHRITTNGSMANVMGEREFRLAREAVRAMQVSVDSPISEEHDRIRGFDGAFNRLTGFIQLMREHGIDTHVSNVLTEDTFPRAEALIEWANGLGVEHVNFQPCNWEANYGDYRAVDDKERFRVPPEQMDDLDEHLERAQETAKRLRITTNLPLLRRWVRAFFECQGGDEFFHDRLFSRFRCYVPHTTVYVGSDGEVFPCTLIRSVGTLRESSLRELWGGKMQGIRDHLDRGKFFKACHSCYCDFPANVRQNLRRHPVRNAGLALRTLSYYTQRLKNYH